MCSKEETTLSSQNSFAFSSLQVLKGWVGEEKGFDPLGVTDALPVYWVREAELKHGRVCMLATVTWKKGKAPKGERQRKTNTHL